MSEVSTMVSQRSPFLRPDSDDNGQPQPPAWRNPSRGLRMTVVAAVYGVHGFLAGALVGAFLGRFLLPACLGAVIAACGGAWLEGRN